MGEEQINRQFKDRLFKLIFETNKEQLLDLYNALRGSHYTNIDDLQLSTLDDVIYIHMKNDLSFLISSDMVLFEQQSSYNPNMPLRQLMYCGKLLSKWITAHKKNLYGKTLIKIPTPMCYVFYNGADNREDIEVLRLSDAFEKPLRSDDPICEWSTTMLNINKGHNQDLLNHCRWLKKYSEFVDMVRCLATKIDTSDAVKETVDYFITQNDDFGELLLQHKSEVIDMCITEFQEAVYEDSIREEGRSEGRGEGLAVGLKNIVLLLK